DGWSYGWPCPGKGRPWQQGVTAPGSEAPCHRDSCGCFLRNGGEGTLPCVASVGGGAVGGEQRFLPDLQGRGQAGFFVRLHGGFPPLFAGQRGPGHVHLDGQRLPGETTPQAIRANMVLSAGMVHSAFSPRFSLLQHYSPLGLLPQAKNEKAGENTL